MTNKKIKVLTLGDHPLLPSGVGSQSKYIFESLLKSGKFQIVTFGGAIQHPTYDPIQTEEYGEDWTLFPVDGYGDANMLRQAILSHQPDILWFMTDPRFYEWLFVMDDEVRMNIPMIYYHVWDNNPYPHFNRPFYEACDTVVSISKVTSELVRGVAPEVEEIYLPHAVDPTIFKKVTTIDEKNLVKEHRIQLERGGKDKTIFFWNNRNARRKQSGTLIFWFKEFLDRVGHDQACLLMHTDPNDPHGQPLAHLLESLKLSEGQVQLSTQKVSPQGLNIFYNAADFTINIADAEGFGLSTLESLSAQTPIIVTMTGGLQEQVTDGENWFGVGIEPTSKAVIGSQRVPYIFEDRINKEEFIEALTTMHNLTQSERDSLGKLGRQHVEKNYNFQQYAERWIKIMEDVHAKYGSWQTRKNYDRWEIKEI